MKQKHAIRAAVKLFDACQNMRPKPQPISIDILQDSIDRLLSVISTYNTIIEKGWNPNSSADNVTTQRYSVRQALNMVENCINANSAQKTTLKPDLQSIYSDILHLGDDFETVSIDLKRSIISVETDSIEFEGIDLGRFEIKINLGSMDYLIEALDPNPSNVAGYVHPHLNGGALCEGAGSGAISLAMETGRLLDMLIVLRTILETYNPKSAYCEMDKWAEGSSCASCDFATEEMSYCEFCNSAHCDDCIGVCAGCETFRCLNCFASCCEYCEDRLCSTDCGKTCSNCGEVYCPQCVDDKLTDGLCSGCLEVSEESVVV